MVLKPRKSYSSIKMSILTKNFFIEVSASLFSFIFFSVANLQEKVRPRTCKDIQNQETLQPDGSFFIYPRRNSCNFFIEVYCEGMATNNPREYITSRRLYNFVRDRRGTTFFKKVIILSKTFYAVSYFLWSWQDQIRPLLLQQDFICLLLTSVAVHLSWRHICCELGEHRLINIEVFKWQVRCALRVGMSIERFKAFKF